MATSSRKTALTALSEVTENEGYSNIVIDKAIRAAELSPRDAALASTIFDGVLEKRLTLDFYIRKFLAKPKQKLDGARCSTSAHRRVPKLLYCTSTVCRIPPP